MSHDWKTGSHHSGEKWLQALLILEKATEESERILAKAKEEAALIRAGLALGLVGLFSGIKQGEVSAHGIEGIGSGYDVFGKTMVLAVFPELYAIVAFAATFLISAGI